MASLLEQLNGTVRHLVEEAEEVRLMIAAAVEKTDGMLQAAIDIAESNHPAAQEMLGFINQVKSDLEGVAGTLHAIDDKGHDYLAYIQVNPV